MPIKKPKQVKLPAPFRDLESDADDDVRRRALLMKRELQSAEGFSWNAPREPWIVRFRRGMGIRAWGLVGALGMGALLVGGFLIAADTGVRPPIRVIYVESWRGDRTAEEAIAEREEAMNALRRRIEEHNRLVAEAEARQKALDAERAAARQATTG